MFDEEAFFSSILGALWARGKREEDGNTDLGEEVGWIRRTITEACDASMPGPPLPQESRVLVEGGDCRATALLRPR